MTQTVTKIDQKRFDKMVEAAVKAADAEDRDIHEFNKNVLEAYRALDDEELLRMKAKELGVSFKKNANASKKKFAILKEVLPERCRHRINRAISSERVAEVVVDMEQGAHALPAVSDSGAAKTIVADTDDSDEGREIIQERLQLAQELAEDRGSKKVSREDAKIAVSAQKEGVSDIRSYKKQVDELQLALNVVHACEQIAGMWESMTPDRLVRVLREREDMFSDFKKSFGGVVDYLNEIQEEI